MTSKQAAGLWLMRSKKKVWELSEKDRKRGSSVTHFHHSGHQSPTKVNFSNFQHYFTDPKISIDLCKTFCRLKDFAQPFHLLFPGL